MIITSGLGGRVELRGRNIDLAPLDLPCANPDDKACQLPTMIVADDMVVYANSNANIRGFIYLQDEFTVQNSHTNIDLTVEGKLVSKGFKIPPAYDWQSTTILTALYNFRRQSDVAYFPDWLETRHNLPAKPPIVIKPDSSDPDYQWHDWSQPLFQLPVDPNASMWEVVGWTEQG